LKKGEKKKRDRALKKRTARKQALRRPGTTVPSSYHIRQARNYPIDSCWVQRNWDQGGLVVVVVARRQPDGNLVFGSYLVDTYCLGLKNTDSQADIPSGPFRREYLPRAYSQTEPPIDISPALAHEIVYGGIEYAAQWGFRPHSDFMQSQYVLDPPDQHPRTGTVEFGREGKPFYVQGPYDDVDAILRQLTRTAGEGNFHFMIGIGDPPLDWDEDLD